VGPIARVVPPVSHPSLYVAPPIRDFSPKSPLPRMRCSPQQSAAAAHRPIPLSLAAAAAESCLLCARHLWPPCPSHAEPSPRPACARCCPRNAVDKQLSAKSRSITDVPSPTGTNACMLILAPASSHSRACSHIGPCAGTPFSVAGTTLSSQAAQLHVTSPTASTGCLCFGLQGMCVTP
jgi:hypothetical protein